MKYRLCIFDLDGTVLDTMEDLQNSVNYTLNKNGLPERSSGEIKAFVGNGIQNLVMLSAGFTDITPLAERVLADFRLHYAVHCADVTKPYDGITEIISSLRQAGVLCAVVSNKSDDGVKKLTDKYFSGLFCVAVGEKEGIKRKPAPDSINEILRITNIKKENAVYIGDSEVDIMTAKNAQIDCISVTWGFRDKEQLMDSGASVMADTPWALLKYLQL